MLVTWELNVASFLQLSRGVVWESKDQRNVVIVLEIPLENWNVSIRSYLHEDPQHTVGSKNMKNAAWRTPENLVDGKIERQAEGKKATLVESGHIVKWNK